MSISVTLTDATGNSRSFSAQSGESLYEVLSRNGVPVNAPCGGRGKCGKCKVKIHWKSKISTEIALACQTVLEEDCEISLIDDESKILLQGKKHVYNTDKKSGYAMGVDIGTTTVAAYLLDAATGQQLAASSRLNPQRVHGADVISRIGFADESKENRKHLQTEITDMLHEVRKELLKSAHLPEDTLVPDCCLVGNTAMMHLAGGFDTAGIAKAPYLPEYVALHTQTLTGSKYCLGGCVSGYVGADTLAAMLACDMESAKDNVLLIDIGTNGEIVLKSNGKYSCCSCAAGPAFEGAHIQCGTGAVNGAVDHLYAAGDSFIFTTVGSAAPIGICGSGLVDIVAYLLQNEYITPLGRMSERFEIAENVFIDPSDIREVQLAKAAIAAGIEILADRAGIGLEQIDRVLLAGGFGNYIDVHSACLIGLLPGVLEKKIIPVGNAAGDGAKMIALSVKARIFAEELRKKTEYIELSAQDDFEDIYTDNLVLASLVPRPGPWPGDGANRAAPRS